MRRFVGTALIGGLILMLGGVPSLAADSPQATVSDFINLIAASKKMKVEEVESFLAARGVSLESRALLTERIAADLFGSLGVRVSASGDRAIRSDQLNRLRPLASFVTLEANAGTDEVRNRGIKVRAGGRQPNSNANVNAFETLREDPR